MIRRRLLEFEQAGIDQVICLSQAGRLPHDLLCSSIELFAEEVLPQFKERDQRAAGQQAQRRERLSEIAMARRLKTACTPAKTLIRAAGHH